jgi:hypothetical protein
VALTGCSSALLIAPEEPLDLGLTAKAGDGAHDIVQSDGGAEPLAALHRQNLGTPAGSQSRRALQSLNISLLWQAASQVFSRLWVASRAMINLPRPTIAPLSDFAFSWSRNAATSVLGCLLPDHSDLP